MSKKYKCPRCSNTQVVKDLYDNPVPYFRAYCSICFEFLGLETTDFDRQDILDFVMPFGKYRGKKVMDLPQDYLEWLKKNVQMSDILRCAVEAYVGKEKAGASSQ